MSTEGDTETGTPGGITTENDHGEWVPAIPVPFYGLRKGCHCGQKFWTMPGYRGHYALAHILRTP